VDKIIALLLRLGALDSTVPREPGADAPYSKFRGLADESAISPRCSFAKKQESAPREDDRAHLPGDTRAGEIELQIPKIRQGSYFPGILEPRRRSEQALLAVVQQAYVCGVSTRRVDQLVESFRLRISRSEVSVQLAIGPAIRSQRASDKMRLVW
jgi:Transposase, Mutator family